MRKRTILLILLAVLFAGTILRLAYLTADPPTTAPFSSSILGAPGRYASAARGMLLFEQPSLGKDRFFAMSPLMTGFNYLVYKFFGVNFITYRSLPLIFGILCLVLVAVLAYRYLGALACLITTIFLAFNYPLVIYSKAANRLFPMLLFFLISLWLFLKGIEKQKLVFFITSAISFFLSFLSRGSLLYMVLLFLAMGVLHLRKKEIRLAHLLIFFAVLSSLMVVWIMIVYLPSKELLSAVLADNRQLRAVPGFKRLIYNVFHFPFFSGFRSDLVMPSAALFSLFVVGYRKLKGELQLPLLIKASLLWLMLGIAVHLPFSYSPLRFFVDLAFPASLLAGWGLQEWLDSRVSITKDKHFWHTLLVVGIVTLVLGVLPLMPLAVSLLKGGPFLLILILTLMALSYYNLMDQKKRFKGVVLGFILLLSIVGNLRFFSLWAGQRQYQAVHISGVLASAIPPSAICGWMAALVTIGTPHRDTVVWHRGINWQRDFFTRNKIEYLFLADYFPEESKLQPMFASPVQKAHLLAIFKMFQSNFYLLDISGKVYLPHNLEAEAFTRESGRVFHDPQASRKMALLIKPWKFKNVQLQKEFSLDHSGTYNFFLHGRGQARIEVEILDSRQRHQPRVVNFNGENSIRHSVQFKGLEAGSVKIYLKVEPKSGPFTLDRIHFQVVAEDLL